MQFYRIQIFFLFNRHIFINFSIHVLTKDFSDIYSKAIQLVWIDRASRLDIFYLLTYLNGMFNLDFSFGFILTNIFFVFNRERNNIYQFESRPFMNILGFGSMIPNSYDSFCSFDLVINNNNDDVYDFSFFFKSLST